MRRSQAGRYQESLEMALKCLDILKNSSNEMRKEEHNEKLMYIYGQIAHLKYYVSIFECVFTFTKDFCLKREQTQKPEALCLFLRSMFAYPVVS